jgi:hypothetical protein
VAANERLAAVRPKLVRGHADCGYDALTLDKEEEIMPTRTQTSKRPSAGRFGRPAGKAVQRPGGARRPASSRLPTMATRRRPERSGAAKAAEKLGSLLPGGGGRKPKPGAAGGRSKKGTAGLALLAGAAALAMKNRDKLMSTIRRADSSHEAAHPVEAQPVPSTPERPETNAAGARLGSTVHPTT